VENDVCYPQSDVGEDEPPIDFEELEEFVAETAQTRFPRLEDLSLSPENIVKVNSHEPDEPVVLPPSALHPSEEAFEELEKCEGNVHTPSELRATVADSKMPFWTFFSSEYDDTIHSTSIGGLLEEGETFKQLFTVNSEGGCWWLDVVRPSEAEVTAICKAFSIHPLTREDIATQESREKVELFQNYYFVAFRSFENADKDSETYLDPVNIYGVVFRHGVITFSYSTNPHASNVLKRIGRLRDHMQLSADWICYAIIDDIVDNFMPVIGDIEREVDSIEDEVFTARHEDARNILRAIGDSRKKVMSLMRLLGGKYDVIKGFAKRCNDNFGVAPRGEVGIYLSDIQDHVVTMRDNLSHSEQLLSRVHNNFLAQINVENITHGNTVNQLLGKVTLVATILVPMNLLTGLFGMNVPVPGRGSSGVEWFMGIVGVIVVIVLVALVAARRMRLI
jgi:magnesium transporter